MVTDDETVATVARRHDLNQRWNQAKEAVWQTDAEHALQIDLALRESDRQLLACLANNGLLARSVRELARLAWDEICETPDPRRQPNQLEA